MKKYGRHDDRQAIGQCAIQQGYKVLYRETHILLDELADAVAGGTRKEYMESVATVPLLIIDDFGMRKLPHTAAEDLLEIIMRPQGHVLKCGPRSWRTKTAPAS